MIVSELQASPIPACPSPILILKLWMWINEEQKSGRQRYRRGNRGLILCLLKAKGTSILVCSKCKVFGGKEWRSQKRWKRSEKTTNFVKKKKQKWKRKTANSCSPWHLVYGFTFGRHKRSRKMSSFNKNLHWQDLTLRCGPNWYRKQSRHLTPYMFVKSLWPLVAGHDIIFCFSCCQ